MIGINVCKISWSICAVTAMGGIRRCLRTFVLDRVFEGTTRKYCVKTLYVLHLRLCPFVCVCVCYAPVRTLTQKILFSLGSHQQQTRSRAADTQFFHNGIFLIPIAYGPNEHVCERRTINIERFRNTLDQLIGILMIFKDIL